MIDHKLLTGKKIALIIWNTEDEVDVRVFPGEIIQKGSFHFINVSEKWNITLTDEMLSRINKVSDELKEMLFNAEFAISLSLASLPDNSSEGFDPTGMKWR